jgi:transcriptional regulator with XRE-family HTH domain
MRDLLRLRREGREVSARRLSLDAGLSDSVVGKIESGEIHPSLRAFARIALQLQLSDREIALLVRLAASDNHEGDRR